MQATENRTITFSLLRTIYKNITGRSLNLLHFFKGTPIGTAVDLFFTSGNGHPPFLSSFPPVSHYRDGWKTFSVR